MDPITLSQEVEERYRRYLKTTFFFKDPKLRASFAAALDAGHLSKGPYLEATPVFTRAQPARALFTDLLRAAPDEGFLQAIQGDRPLYGHQEAAIRGVAAGYNVLVATGTGSGKTEAFLYPILLRLYEQQCAGSLGPGVRALILYPMNALANDQRERLGGIARGLEEAGSPFRFTFGQYTGETPEDEGDRQRQAQDRLANRMAGELILRREMREAPPHILLTNYSMLEYLLLRPDDSPLFDDGRAADWEFLVLDEAHQYRGYRGIEMAMLLRRLKWRLRDGGRAGQFCCIATSASLAGGDEDRPAVAAFAATLFGEPFRDQHIILGQAEPLPLPGPTTLTVDDYALLYSVADMPAPEAVLRLAGLAARAGLPLAPTDDIGCLIGRLLLRDARAGRLRQHVAASPVDVQHLGEVVFPELPSAGRAAALAGLVDLLLRAEDPASGAPLLSARYHLFLRTLEGAFVTYWPERRVFLDRKAIGDGGSSFEVAVCRECGQHYFVGPKDFAGGRLGEAVRDPGDPQFGASFFRPLEADPGDDEEETQAAPARQYQFCVRCGQLSRARPSCGHGEVITVVREEPPKDEDRADQQARCGACGYTAGGRDPVREIMYGNDGPNAVIATTLYRALPPARRKVLAFADGRQEAAYFAWYLQRSYEDLLSRNLVLTASRRLAPHAPGGLTLGELATALRSLVREYRLLPPATGELALLREAWRRLYREFLTDERRIGLEGVGLARWSLKWPEWMTLPQELLRPPWSLSETEAWDLLAMLLDGLRTDRAIAVRADEVVSLGWADLELTASPILVRLGRGGKGGRGVAIRSWEGERAHGMIGKTQRTLFLARLLGKDDPDPAALATAAMALRAIWGAWQRAEVAVTERDRLLLPVDDARQLNPAWWRLRCLAPNDRLFQCDTCNRLQAVSVRGLCPRRGCPGRLVPRRLGDLEPNHYRLLYEEEWPGLLRVEEHTAQLSTERARAFQQAFKAGHVHVLSCSTTFELGVDLGDLDTIFLRNVPPEAFNYAQRVGRAGRRRAHVGFAITYCRRTPHDLYHFAEPGRMLSGRVGPPTVQIRNDKIIDRHLTAVALSAFFRAHADRFRTVETLLGSFAQPAAAADCYGFFCRQRTALEMALGAIVPADNAELRRRLGLHDGSWMGHISGTESRLALAEAEVASDYGAVRELEAQAAKDGDYATATWARDRARTIAGEPVLTFLSRKAVIPKYGFPVDVVELDTQRTQAQPEGRDVSLQRDLAIAISEFAPSARLIANKKEWESYGLKRVAEREWRRRHYKRCPQHNVFLDWEISGHEPPTPCGCHLDKSEYIIPSFGFVTERTRPREPSGRPPRAFSTRPYFAGAEGPAPEALPLPATRPVLTLTRAAPGRMMVLCEGRRGQGFYVCEQCGAGFRQRKRSHQTPFGRPCRGLLGQVSLGHEFLTDVVQLQFHTRPQEAVDAVWFANALASAVVEGAAAILEVPSADINATVAFSDGAPVLPIILYDNAPGGAGLVARLEMPGTIHACLTMARERVSGRCGCDEATSCYGCLRTYRNQFAHQHLQRGSVWRYLAELLDAWRGPA